LKRLDIRLKGMSGLGEKLQYPLSFEMHGQT